MGKWVHQYDLTALPKDFLFVNPSNQEAIREANPDAILWSGEGPPPEIGARVCVTMNDFGPSTVTGYFVEHGFLGIHVRPDKRSAWHRKQQPGRDVICVFGIEYKRI